MELVKWTCLDEQVLDNSDEWHDAIRALLGFHVEFYAQCKNRKQRQGANNATGEQASIDVEFADVGWSEQETDDHADVLIVDTMVNLQNETTKDDLIEEDWVELDTATATKDHDNIAH